MMADDVKSLKESYKESLISADQAEKGVDRDRCSDVWKRLYIPLYSPRDFWNGADFTKYRERIPGLKKEYEIYHEGLKTRVSGDVLFSFKSEKDGARGKGKKYEHYRRVIEDDGSIEESEKKRCLEMLEFCHAMNYSLHNMGFMPVKGNLQAVKERDWDRLDRYLFRVNEYFAAGNKETADLIRKIPTPGGRYPAEIIRGKTKEEMEEERRNRARSEVRIMLDRFESIAKKSGIKDVKENGVILKAGTILYSREMYLIDRYDLLAGLIDHGSREITNGSAVAVYLGLAIKYWKMRSERSDPGS